MRYFILLLFLASLFAGFELVGVTDLTGMKTKVWPEGEPSSMDRIIGGGVAFLLSLLLAGIVVKGVFGGPRKRLRYPSTLGELDQYTGYLNRK